MKSKNVLITGITGQDGAYLAKFLLKKNYNVFGAYRRLSTPNFWRLKDLKIDNDINYLSVDLLDFSSIIEAIKTSKPDEVYHLAAQSYVGASFDQPITSIQSTGVAVTSMLEAIRIVDPKIKFYQASSSELYGNIGGKNQNENTSFAPQSPYASSKLYGYWMTKIYRDAYDMFTTNGILFNHESPMRGLEFVTRKITNAVARIKIGLDKELRLGNLNSQRDWGYAPEYVEGMWKILQQKHPDDYVLATGETKSVREFCEIVFNILDLDMEKYVRSDKKFFRPAEVEYLRGDASKARKKLNWEPKTSLNELAKLMVESDLEYHKTGKLR